MTNKQIELKAYYTYLDRLDMGDPRAGEVEENRQRAIYTLEVIEANKEYRKWGIICMQ